MARNGQDNPKPDHRAGWQPLRGATGRLLAAAKFAHRVSSHFLPFRKCDTKRHRRYHLSHLWLWPIKANTSVEVKKLHMPLSVPLYARSRQGSLARQVKGIMNRVFCHPTGRPTSTLIWIKVSDWKRRRKPVVHGLHHVFSLRNSTVKRGWEA